MSFEDDVRAQPDALRALVAHAGDVARSREEIPWRRARRVVLAGMGSSHFAGYAAWLALVRSGHAAWNLEAAELLHYAGGLVDEQTILILVSQSGESVEVRRLLEELPAAGRPFVVGITNDPESTLGQRADVVIELHAGREEAVSTKTCLNTMAAFDLLVGDGQADELSTTADLLEGWLDSLASHVGITTDLVGLPRSVVVVGRGPSLTSARIGALILKEATKTHTEALSGGELRHGPVELAAPHLTLLVLRGPTDTAGLQQRLAGELATHARVGWIGSEAPPNVGVVPSPELPGDVGRLIGELVSLQVTVMALARAEGIVPGVFALATKVTTAE